MPTDAALTTRILSLRDGRDLELFLAGPAQATPLVFHNGTPSTGAPYGAFVEAVLAHGLRWISWSRPGYAGSTRDPGRSVASVAADAAEVLDHLDAERCYVAGWSGGGPHALATAALLPERVIATAVLAGVAPHGAPGLDWMAGMGDENVAEFGAALAGADELTAFLDREGRWVRDVTPDQVATGFGDLIDEVDRGKLTGAFAEYTAATFRSSVSRGPWGWFDDDVAFTRPWGFDLHAIARPTFIWQGAHDRMVPYAHGAWLVRHVGAARARLLPEHGHLSLTVGAIGQVLDELTAVHPGADRAPRRPWRIDGMPVAEFGFPGPLRDELVAAILRGEKTSTSGLLSDYEREGERIASPGERQVVVDSAERGVAIIEITEARVLRVDEVDARFAHDEGEGFADVAAWRAAHERFWHSYAEETRAWLGDPDWRVTDATQIVAERFRLVERLAGTP